MVFDHADVARPAGEMKTVEMVLKQNRFYPKRATNLGARDNKSSK